MQKLRRWFEMFDWNVHQNSKIIYTAFNRLEIILHHYYQFIIITCECVRKKYLACHQNKIENTRNARYTIEQTPARLGHANYKLFVWVAVISSSKVVFACEKLKKKISSWKPNFFEAEIQMEYLTAKTYYSLSTTFWLYTYILTFALANQNNWLKTIGVLFKPFTVQLFFLHSTIINNNTYLIASSSSTVWLQWRTTYLR